MEGDEGFYVIVVGKTETELETLVNRYHDKGYFPTGGIAYDRGYICQAVVKYWRCENGRR